MAFLSENLLLFDFLLDVFLFYQRDPEAFLFPIVSPFHFTKNWRAPMSKTWLFFSSQLDRYKNLFLATSFSLAKICEIGPAQKYLHIPTEMAYFYPRARLPFCRCLVSIEKAEFLL